MQGWCDVLLCPEEQPGGEGVHHQAAEGGAEAGGGQAGAAEEAPPEPDAERHPAEGPLTAATAAAAAHLLPVTLPVLLSDVSLHCPRSPPACPAPRRRLLSFEERPQAIKAPSRLMLHSNTLWANIDIY